jgi:hypothetical protein
MIVLSCLFSNNYCSLDGSDWQSTIARAHRGAVGTRENPNTCHEARPVDLQSGPVRMRSMQGTRIVDSWPYSANLITSFGHQFVCLHYNLHQSSSGKSVQALVYTNILARSTGKSVTASRLFHQDSQIVTHRERNHAFFLISRALQCLSSVRRRWRMVTLAWPSVW